MTGQHDWQDESLTGQIHNQSGHCPLTGRYFEPWVSRGQINFNPADELLQCTETGLYYLETNQHPLMLPFYYKRFDSVPHQRLLLKSKSYGIEGGLQEWF